MDCRHLRRDAFSDICPPASIKILHISYLCFQFQASGIFMCAGKSSSQSSAVSPRLSRQLTPASLWRTCTARACRPMCSGLATVKLPRPLLSVSMRTRSTCTLGLDRVEEPKSPPLAGRTAVSARRHHVCGSQRPISPSRAWERSDGPRLCRSHFPRAGGRLSYTGRERRPESVVP